MQDRGSGGRVPGGEGSQGAETWSRADTGNKTFSTNINLDVYSGS